MKKILLALPLMFAAQSALADQFYLDPGSNFDGVLSPTGGKVCDTCTSVKDEYNFIYQSSSTIFDTNGNFTIDAGDTISTDGGLSVGGLGSNVLTGFNPNEVFGLNSNNDYGDDWLLSFSISGLAGVVTDVIGGVPIIAYGPGLLELFVTFDGVTLNNFMDIAVSGGGTAVASSYLFGNADFSAVSGSYGNLFHTNDNKCNNTVSGLFDIWSTCGEGSAAINPAEIKFALDFNTNLLTTNFAFNGVDTFTVTSNHDGSGTLAVPEPASIAMLGLGLLGLAGFRRRA